MQNAYEGNFTTVLKDTAIHISTLKDIPSFLDRRYQ